MLSTQLPVRTRCSENCLLDFIFKAICFYQGQLYGLLSDINGLSVMMQIPIGNPGGATVVHTFPGLSGLVGGISVIYNGVETVFMLGYNEATGESALYQVDMMTGVATVFVQAYREGTWLRHPILKSTVVKILPEISKASTLLQYVKIKVSHSHTWATKF